MRINSDATLRSLRPKDKEYSVPDRKMDGLNIRVRPSGNMAWVFRYQLNGKSHKLTLGNYDQKSPSNGMTLEQARNKAGGYRSWIENGLDPKEQLVKLHLESQAAKTFDDAYQSYNSKHLVKHLTADQTRKIYSRDIQPHLGSVKLKDLSISDLMCVFDSKVDKAGKPLAGAIAACFKVINQVLKHAIALGLMERHPAPHLTVKDIGGGTKIGKRNLDFTELQALLIGLESWATDPVNIRLMKFLIASGQRISAILEMRWDEVDLDKRVWTIPPSSTTRHTKSPEPRKVPLSDFMLGLLVEQRANISQRWKLVWPQVYADRLQEPSAIRSLIKRNLPKEVEHFSPHDLRRTFISRCNELRLDPVSIEKTVGHQLTGMLRVYNHHSYFDEQAEVLQRWGEKLESLTVANVVPITARTSA